MSVEFYNKNAKDFFENTVNASMKEHYEFFENRLSEKGEILDLGCGSGRDSKYFLDNGYKVTAIDLSEELAKKASEHICQEVLVMNMLDIDFKNRFCGIWACASLLHLTEIEIIEVLKKCFVALKEDGVIYASFKYGDENYEKDGRHFTCFTEDKFSKLMSFKTGYSLTTFITEDVRPGRSNEKWLNVILKEA